MGFPKQQLHQGFHEFPEGIWLESGDFFPHGFWDWSGDEFGHIFFKVPDVSQLACLPGFEGEKNVLKNEAHEACFDERDWIRDQIKATHWYPGDDTKMNAAVYNG